MALILAFIFFGRATRAKSCPALLKVAAGLLMDTDDDSEEVGFRQRHAFVNLRQASPSGIPMVCVSMMVRNSLFTGSGASLVMTRRLSMQRQASLDATNDDVDSIRKRGQKFSLAPLLEKFEQPQRQAAARRKAETQRRHQSGVEHETTRECGDAEQPTGDEEALLRPAQPGLRDTAGQRGRLGAPVFDFFQCRLNLPATDPRAASPTSTRSGRNGVRQTPPTHPGSFFFVYRPDGRGRRRGTSWAAIARPGSAGRGSGKRAALLPARSSGSRRRSTAAEVRNNQD